jgi:hypothetical protein
MSGFTPDSFTLKLSKLSDSQQSIQTLSHWVQYHKKACVESAAVWAAEALRAPTSRQLLFIYLVNDIMQHSRRKGPEFVKAYGDRLVQVFPRIFADASSSVQAKLLRTLNIWDERRVLSSSVLTELRAKVGAGADGDASQPPADRHASTAAARPAAAPSTAAQMDVVEEDDEYVPEPLVSAASGGAGGGEAGGMALADLLEMLDQGSLADELQAEREADLDMSALQEVDVSEPSELGAVGAKAGAAIALLTAQRCKIVEELAARRRLIMLLAASVERQNEQVQHAPHTHAARARDCSRAQARS